jgi:hypothetical protein
LAITGGAITARLAEAVKPVPPSTEAMAPVTLFFAPVVVLVTFTAKVHEALAARDPAERLTTPEAAVAVIVPPPQVPESPLGVEITRPAGKVSVKATPERLCVALAFWMVKVNDVVPASGIVATPNTLEIVGGATTVTVAFEVLPTPEVVEVTCTLLFFTPAVAPCTFTDTRHDIVTGNAPAARLTEDEPATAVAVPPHVFVRLGVAATVKPAGKLSVNARPARAAIVFGFWMLKVNRVVPVSGMVGFANAFTMIGGVATVRGAVAVLPVPPFVELTAPEILV